MSQEDFKVEIKNKLAVITITRPKRKNAINLKSYRGITKALNDISDRDDVTFTALTGTGDYFSSGNDLKALLPSDDRPHQETMGDNLGTVRNFVEAFITHKKILVAVVNGPAIGIAATILPLFDIVYCTPNAWFQTPFAQLGICAEAASSYTYKNILGPSLANEMLLLSIKLSSEEALARGFVSRIVKTEDLEAKVWESLRKAASELSPKSLAATKKLTRRFEEATLLEASRLEIKELKYLFQTEEAYNALVSFLSRRSKY